jgi:hypothetical protein
MTSIRIVQVGLIAAAAVTIAAARLPKSASTVRACDASSPHAKAFLATANSTFPRLDSLRRLRLGWNAAPKSVTLVSSSATCDAVVAAHNRFVNGKYAAYRVTTPVIARADGSYLVDVPPGGPSEELIFIYDSAFQFRAIY